MPALQDMYGETRRGELQSVPWSDAQKQAFVAMQFQAQDAHYRKNYPGAALCVILVDGKRAGRYYVYRSETEIRLMDIIVAKHFRRRGIARALLEELIDEAEQSGLPLTLHVEPDNPILPFYRALGFVARGETGGVYQFMERTPRTRMHHGEQS
ncbi:MAG: GNAT family N-acetyltransferase [Ectothiorhodospiraceae bacterium]|nr:GNAT family N-acetyltransferase [Ectothiorhodospiraceae bacterium]MCH8505566.1 GNAT family N-acetyltransferase [Ectothiorhodospiraceae bacterium]